MSGSTIRAAGAMPEIRQETTASDEHALIRGVARGDEEAVDELYRTHADALFRFVYRRVGESYEDAEEITLDTFLSAVALAGNFRRAASVKTWLCGIAKLRLIDFHRRKVREKRIPENRTISTDDPQFNNLFIGALASLRAREATVEQILDRIDAAQTVDLLLAMVSEDEREALLMRYVDELSLIEISQLMGRSEKGVECLLNRARKKQREVLLKWMEADILDSREFGNG